jgi:Nuclease A inhibitor-like protein
MPMDSETSTLVAQLQAATDGLLWISETDAPFAMIHWQAAQASDLPHQQLLELTHHSPETVVETVDLDEFFGPAIQKHAWFGAEEQAISARYGELVTILQHNLRDLKVYRVGEMAIDIYIVGQTEAGEVLGLATQVVET